MSVKVAKVTSATAAARELRSDTRNCRKAELQNCRKERDKALTLPFLQSFHPAILQCHCFFSSRHPRGGTMRLTECSKPCAAIGSESTPPGCRHCCRRRAPRRCSS